MTSRPFNAPLMRSTAICLGLSLSLELAAEEQDLFQLSLEDLVNIEIEVATKSKRPLSQSPSSVTVFTRQQLMNMGLTQVEQALNFVPGFDASRDQFLGQGSAVTPRGRRSSQNAVDVLFLVDGQRINSDTSGGALQLNRYLGLGNVKQLEIIRGPGSALYGSNAFLGVVNLVTDKQLNEVQFSQSLEGQTRVNGSYSHSDDDWAHSLSIDATHDRGVDYSINGQATDDPWHQLQINWRSQGDKLSLSGHYQRQEFENFYLFGSLANDVNDLDSASGFLRADYLLLDQEDRQASGYLSYQDSHSNALIQVFDTDFMTALQAAGMTAGRDAFIAGFDNRNNEINAGLDGQININRKHSIGGGVALRHAKVRWLKNINNYELVDFIDVLVLGQAGTIAYYGGLEETSDALTPQSRNIYSGYLHDEYQWAPGWYTTAGIRVDHYSDFGRAITPRATLHYSPQSNRHFKLMYGEAFRAPSINETGIKNSPVEIGNPDLQPEEVTTWELSAQFDQADSQWQATYFHNTIQNAIAPHPIQGDPRTTLSNSGELSSQGLELELSRQLSKHLQLRSNLTHYFDIASEEKSTPAHMASLVLNYQRLNYNINLNGYYRSETEQALNNNERLRAFTQLNLHSRLRLHPELELSLTLTNLTNKDIRTVSFNTPLPGGTPNRGRTISLGLRWQTN